MTHTDPISADGARLAIVGASGHARVVADIADLTGYEVAGFIDDFAATGGTFLDHPILGGREILPELRAQGIEKVFVGIGDRRARDIFASLIEATELDVPALVHPSSIIATRTRIESGALICAGALINPGASIGAFSIVNSGAIVEHDCQIGSFAHVAPGATLAGGVQIGDGAWVGAGATVIEDIIVGPSAMIGAGAVVIRNVPQGEVVMGVPAEPRSR